MLEKDSRRKHKLTDAQKNCIVFRYLEKELLEEWTDYAFMVEETANIEPVEAEDMVKKWK